MLSSLNFLIGTHQMLFGFNEDKSCAKWHLIQGQIKKSQNKWRGSFYYKKILMKIYLNQSRRHTKFSFGRYFMLFFPATISNATIPKLYTSALYVKYPHNAYSSVMPLHRKIIRLVRFHWNEVTSFSNKQIHDKIVLGN